MDADGSAVDDPSIIECPKCAGLGSKVRACACTEAGNTPVRKHELHTEVREAFTDCKRCQGSGSLVYDCFNCEGGGRVRAQVVVSVANIDTAAVASEVLIPGAGEAGPAVDDYGRDRWAFHLKPIIDRLAVQAGAQQVGPQSPKLFDLSAQPIMLDKTYRPDMPTDERLQLEAQALGKLATRHRRRVYIGYSAPRENGSRDAQLRHVCQLARQLCADVTVFRYPDISPLTGKHLGRYWAIAFTHAGAPMPDGNPSGWGRYKSLGEAIDDATDARLIEGLYLQRATSSQHAAPAHYIHPPSASATPVEHGSVSSMEARLDALCGAETPASAIWRDGAWHYSTMERAGEVESYFPWPTGQVRHKTEPTWHLACPPPDPSYWGAAIAEHGCARCETGTAWSACDCVTASDETYRACDTCGGTGWRQDSSCADCGNIGLIRSGLVITVTDLHGYTKHLNLAPNPDAVVTKLGSVGGGYAFHQLESPYRLIDVLFGEGIDLADVTERLGTSLESELLNATVVAPEDATPEQLTRQFCQSKAKHQHAGRRILTVTRPAPDRLAVLVDIAFAMGLDVLIACADHNAYAALPAQAGFRWEVRLIEPDYDLDRENLLLVMNHRYLAKAVAGRLDRLDRDYNKTTPTQALKAPQFAGGEPVDVNGLENVLSTLATRHDDNHANIITVRMNPSQVTFTLLNRPSMRSYLPTSLLAQAPTLARAIALLGLR